MSSWARSDYLDQQRRRLPTHKFRRLHLNLPGAPDGAAFDGALVMAAIVTGRRRLKPQPDVRYQAFVDMSGGSSDDAVLGIAHYDDKAKLAVLDHLVSQTGSAPFNPRLAVQKFSAELREYRLSEVTGDAYAGQTFRNDFEDYNISYRVADCTKAEIYDEFEPWLNAGEVELLDHPKLQEQLLTLVIRGGKIDHQPGDHDDWSNACAGAVWLVTTAAGFSLDAMSKWANLFVGDGEAEALSKPAPLPWHRSEQERRAAEPAPEGDVMEAYRRGFAIGERGRPIDTANNCARCGLPIGATRVFDGVQAFHPGCHL